MTVTRTWKGHVFIATSLDGYISREDGDLDWLTEPPYNPAHATALSGPHAPPGYDEFVQSIDHLVMGRGTYEKVLTFDGWPYAKFRTIVISTTLPSDHDPRITVVRTIDDAVAALDDGGAVGVYVDGGRVIQSFLRHDLIDELTVTVAPVILGGGIPLFGRLDRTRPLTHLGTSSADGMASSRYAVVRT